MTLPKRPPRRMNGMASLMAKARSLPSVTAAAVAGAAAQGAAMLPNSERAAQEALGALLGRLQAAELQVARVRSVVTQIESQIAKLAQDHPYRATSVSIVEALKLALTLPERDGAQPPATP